MNVDYKSRDRLETEEVISLYEANGWSSAQKPDTLMRALENSHSLISARVLRRLVGLGNAISDGHLVVYYPHLLVHPEFHRKGIGRGIMTRLMGTYAGFHQQQLTADRDAILFYESLGFERAGQSEPMWIYQGKEH